jgi:hypothetical protein
VNGFFGTGAADTLATWIAALATLVVLGGLFGERRLFSWSQHLLAGLITGLIGLLVVSEVIAPRLVAPLADDPARGELLLGAALVGVAAGAPWLPRVVAAVPTSIAVGSLAAFALGGAVIGTLLPQIGATIGDPGGAPTDVALSIASAAVTSLVLLAFLRGAPRGRALAAAAGTGRWLLVAGLGGWLGYLLLSRVVLLVDRLAFLLRDWLGVLP